MWITQIQRPSDAARNSRRHRQKDLLRYACVNRPGNIIFPTLNQPPLHHFHRDLFAGNLAKEISLGSIFIPLSRGRCAPCNQKRSFTIFTLALFGAELFAPVRFLCDRSGSISHFSFCTSSCSPPTAAHRVAQLHSWVRLMYFSS